MTKSQAHLMLFQSSSDSVLKGIGDALLPICVICTGLGYGLGMGPVLFALLGEVLPQKVKTLACSIILSLRNMIGFLNLKTFPWAINTFGLHTIFWFHSAMCLLACVWAFAILPETQGKTLTELSNLYEKKKPHQSSACLPNLKELEANNKL